MKALIIATAIALVSSSAYAKDVVLEDKRMSSYDMCYLQASMTVGSMKNSGAKTYQVVDSPAEQMFVYKVVNSNGVVGFVTCTGKQFKVWAMQ